jgi:hypothetical protein
LLFDELNGLLLKDVSELWSKSIMELKGDTQDR